MWVRNYYYGTMTTSGIYKDEKKIRTYKASEKKKKKIEHKTRIDILIQ